MGTGSQTANQHNIIAGVEFALAEADVMLDGVRLVERLTGPDTASDPPFGFLKYERLHREQIDDDLDLVRQADAHRSESNTIRLREALAWNRLSEVHLRRSFRKRLLRTWALLQKLLLNWSNAPRYGGRLRTRRPVSECLGLLSCDILLVACQDPLCQFIDLLRALEDRLVVEVRRI